EYETLELGALDAAEDRGGHFFAPRIAYYGLKRRLQERLGHEICLVRYGDHQIVGLGVDRKGEIGGYRPGRGRPDDGIRRHWRAAGGLPDGEDTVRIETEREPDVDTVRRVVLVLHLRVREGRLARGAPEDRLQSTID